MTNKMPTRSPESNRGRDWGTTPVLFSLKNVQPMLVKGPARPEGNVAAPCSIEHDTNPHSYTSTTTAPAPVPVLSDNDDNRLRPHLAPSRSVNFQNLVATSFVVLLILLVIKISINTKPKDGSVAETRTTESPTISVVATDLQPVTSEPPTPSPIVGSLGVPASSITALELSSQPTPVVLPAEEGVTVSSTGVAASDVPPVPSTPPLLIASGNPPPPPPPSLVPSEVNHEAARPQLDLAPSAPDFAAPKTSLPEGTSGRLDLGRNAMEFPGGMNKDVAVDIMQSPTPNQNYDEMKELWAKANQKSTGAVATAPRANVPYTPVSTGGSSNPYIPVQSSTTATPYQPISGSATVTNPFITGTTTAPGTATIAPTGDPTWATLNGTPGSQTPAFSGQSYPAPSQDYRPITVPEGTTNTNVNRYPAIRQPGAAGNASPVNNPVNNSTQTPYVPIGATSAPPTGTNPMMGSNIETPSGYNVWKPAGYAQ